MQNSLADVVKKGFDDLNRGAFGGVFSEKVGRLVQQHMDEMRSEYPDIGYQVKSAVERGNTVAFDWVATGTHAKTERQISWTGTGVAHVLNGRILAAKVNMDRLARAIQLSDVPRVGFGKLNGKWAGKVMDLGVDIDLGHDEQGVFGSVDVENLGQLAIEGVANDGGIEFTVALPTGERPRFRGVVKSDDTIVGTLEGVEHEIAFSRK
jgi:SnoaL-like polyketide cyclase